MSGELLLGVRVGDKGRNPFKNFTSAPLNCKKSPVFNIKAHFLLDRIKSLLVLQNFSTARKSGNIS